MFTGLLSGIAWGLGTVILGIALSKSAFVSTSAAVMLAPIISTFLHDLCSSVWILLFNGVKRQLKAVWDTLVHTKDGKFICLGAILGGPVGMTGYVLCVKHLGPSIGAVASAIYPAIGAVLAHFFLKERMAWYRWVFLVLSLIGVFMLSYTPELNVQNFALGVAGALMYALGNSIENVILAKCLQNPDVSYHYALNIRQMTSALCLGIVILALSSGRQLTAEILFHDHEHIMLIIGAAALFGTISFLLFGASLIKIGVAKTVAVYGTYSAWAIVFSILLMRDTTALNPVTIISAAMVLVFGVLTAADYKDFHSAV